MTITWSRFWARALACAVLLAAGLGAAQAAATRAYLTASTEPFNDFSNVDAMNAAFGSDWDRLQYGDAFGSYRMLYVDGGSLTATDMVTFLDGNRSALESFVLGGGRLFINAATENTTVVDLVFGARLHEQSINNRSSVGTAVNGASSLFDGAGTSWEGFFFAHNDIELAAGYSALIVDELGRTVVAGGFFGDGYALLGGQTNTSFHDGSSFGSNPFQLRVNQLLYADTVTPPPTGGGNVPEPSTLALAALAMMLSLGFRARGA